jgi:hypothetical protein
MSIPGPDDYELAAIDNFASSIMCKLRLIVRGSWVSTPNGYVQSEWPSARMRSELRELLQTYVNRVMGMADRKTEVEPAPPPARATRRRRRSIERTAKRKRRK